MDTPQNQAERGDAAGVGAAKASYSALSWRTLTVLGVRGLGLGLAFAMNVTLARLMGVEGFGLFSFAVSVLIILEAVALFGLDGVLVREIAAGRERNQPARIKGLILFGGGAILLFSLAAMALAILVISTLLPSSWPYASTLLIALLALPAAALFVGATAILEAHRRPFVGQIIGAMLRPCVLLGTVTVLSYLGWTLTPEIAATIFVGAYILGFLLAAGYLARHVDGGLWRETAEILPGPWMAMAAGFALTNAAFIVTEQTDVMMLAALSDPASVGIYRAAARYAQLVSFALLAAMPPLRPLISAAFARNDRTTQRQACRRVALIAVSIGTPIAIVLVVFAEQFMTLFGAAFEEGATALSILVIGQFLNIIVGPVGILMTMTGHEKKVAAAVGISAVCNILANAVLIPLYNLEGAATATAISLAVWNIIMLYWVIKHLRINPSLFGSSLNEQQ